MIHACNQSQYVGGGGSGSGLPLSARPEWVIKWHLPQKGKNKLAKWFSKKRHLLSSLPTSLNPRHARLPCMCLGTPVHTNTCKLRVLKQTHVLKCGLTQIFPQLGVWHKPLIPVLGRQRRVDLWIWAPVHKASSRPAKGCTVRLGLNLQKLCPQLSLKLTSARSHLKHN